MRSASAARRARSSCRSGSPQTDPFKQISEYVGSGPFRFRKDEWVPGASAVFEKFDGYVPRDEKADWLSGGKRMNFDRIEWQIIPDAATASAALQNGEVDWWETPMPDLVPLLKQNRNLDGRYRRPARQHRRSADEPSVSAVQRPARAPGGADRDQPGRLHAGRRRRGSQSLEGDPPASSRPARRSTPNTAATT